ncbi:uncharacterized protein G2W53_002658 [Senna tora]|uniref:Uncharacterized protein n=1 Tax=Senna tora TaxID=362788 RepID=A0A835CHN1_9FABA|nr:uncharacterized protein G2W53_002658 [Senna tora]
MNMIDKKLDSISVDWNSKVGQSHGSDQSKFTLIALSQGFSGLPGVSDMILGHQASAVYVQSPKCISMYEKISALEDILGEYILTFELCFGFLLWISLLTRIDCLFFSVFALNSSVF